MIGNLWLLSLGSSCELVLINEWINQMNLFMFIHVNKISKNCWQINPLDGLFVCWRAIWFGWHRSWWCQWLTRTCLSLVFHQWALQPATGTFKGHTNAAEPSWSEERPPCGAQPPRWFPVGGGQLMRLKQKRPLRKNIYWLSDVSKAADRNQTRTHTSHHGTWLSGNSDGETRQWPSAVCHVWVAVFTAGS